MNELNSNEKETTPENTSETVAETEAAAPVEETEETPVEATTEEKKVDPQQSWKDVNQKLKKQDEENERLRKENELYQKFLASKEQQQTSKQEEAFDINKLPDDDLAEYGAIKKARKQDQQYYQQLEERLVMAEMRQKHSDFNEVFTQDNLRALRDVDIDLAEAILSTGSQEKQLRMAYNAIKRYGIHKSKVEKETVMLSEYNAARPKPSNAAAPSQEKGALAKAASFEGMPMTKEIREEIYKRAREKARQR